MVMLLNIRRGAGKSVVGQVPCPLDLKRPKYDSLKFCIATMLLPRPTPHVNPLFCMQLDLQLAVSILTRAVVKMNMAIITESDVSILTFKENLRETTRFSQFEQTMRSN